MTGHTEPLPNRFDYQQAQARIYKFWEAGGYFHAEPNPDKQPYSIVIPPPNVTGALHLGHALNNTLQDTMIRMKRMQGFEALWMPGTDHAGIATQAVVEKRLKEEEGLTRHDLGPKKLVERIWQWKEQYEARILNQLKQMGCSCDWQRTRFTLDETCARAVRETFFDLFQKGLIYRGKRLVNWDTHLQTAVSDDEVFHDPVKGHFWHIRYPVIDPKPGEPTHIEIATTRPETMLGDTAVAVHPDPTKALDKAERELQDKLAKAPAKEKPDIQKQLDAIGRRRESMLAQLEQLRDMALDGRMIGLPLTGRQIPLITDEWAKPELGSGCVKITPAHDQNDYDVWQRHAEIGAINIMNADGTLNENAPERYRGLKMHTTARSKVLEDLESQGLLGEIEDREIDLAHSDRSKTPIEPYLADQWFVKMDELAQSAMDAVTDGRVKIFPSRYTKSYLDWLGEKRDWCISRNLWWGHRIPVWTRHYESYGEYCGAGMRTLRDAENDELSDRLSSLEQNYELVCARFVRDEDPGRTFHEQPPDEGGFTIYVSVRDDKIVHPEVYNRGIVQLMEELGFIQSDEVLDTWFSSQLWPHSTLGWPEQTKELDYFYPTSVLITSRDIITLWVARMVLSGLNNMGPRVADPKDAVPFREVFIHPKILDGYGEGMSKSKGNGVDPLDVIDKFGPDALRFGLAYLTTETQDVKMPVQFECPHCEALLDQTKKNRELPRIECPKCGEAFSTQWARKEEDTALPRGPVVSERFEQARNFCNKLWNAARFCLMNLEGYAPGMVADADLAVEDRWLLSRLATVTQEVTRHLETYHFAEAMRSLYDFAWDDFCSFYVEIAKERLQNEATRGTAQRVLAHSLDVLLRLLHPVIPFITEEVWQLLNQVAPQRGLAELSTGTESIMIAAWPRAEAARQDKQIESQFATFQQVLGAVREIRSRQNIAPKKPTTFCLRAGADAVKLLEPLQAYFEGMANATVASWGPDVTPPATNAHVQLGNIDVFVDLTGLIDVAAEIQRLEKEQAKTSNLIEGKSKKLDNASFVERAPAEVVQKEREALAQLEQQLSAIQTALSELRLTP